MTEDRSTPEVGGANTGAADDETEPAAGEARTTRLSREDVFSWLSGPGGRASYADDTRPHRGARLGYPEDGPGSIASFARRLWALTIDWLSCYVLGWAIVARMHDGAASIDQVRVWNTGLFVLEVWLLTWLGGASFGQRLTAMRVQRVDGGRLGPLRVLLRTVLILLVIPAVIWDRDGRGLHDKAAGSVVVRR
jgi:uncharacterized RDD family membrane protein YckC